jgi:hypothetical protein
VQQADLRDIFRKFPKNICTSTVVVSPDVLAPIPSTSSAMKASANTERNPDDPESADEEDIK